MKKILLVALLAITTVTFAVAGGKSDSKSSTSSASGSDSNKVVTLNHWYVVSNADTPRYAELIARFNETHPNIKVVWENLPQKEARTKFITAYQVGEGPDTIGIDANLVPEFSAMGMLEPLDSYIAKWPGRNDIFETLWDAENIDGKQFGMPWKLLVTYMYYRKDWFKEAGLSVPQNMAELVKAAHVLTGKYKDESGNTLDRYGFGLRGGTGNAQTYYIWVQSYGVKLYDEKGNVTFNTPLAVKATQDYLDLYQKEKVVPPSAVGDGFAEIIGAFKSGRTAMVNHHIGTHVEISGALGDKVGVALFPAGPTGLRWAEGGIVTNCMTVLTKHKDEAFEFISWMSENEAVEFESRYLGSIPITKTVSAMPYFSENEFYRVSNEAVPYVGAWPKNITWGNVVSSFTVRTLQQALMGELSAQQVVEMISAELAK